jgi:hypothetical protein
MNTINKEWFVNQLSRKGQSIRGLGRFLDIDASAVSRMFDGKRNMKMDEAEKIARFLAVTTEEVLKQAGVSLDSSRVRPILLKSTVFSDGHLETLPEPLEISPELMARVQANVPFGNRGNMTIAQVRAEDGPMSVLDDAIVVYEQSDTIEPAPKGVLSISRLRDGVTMIGHIESARKTGEATIRTPDGKLKKVLIEASSPVLAIIP